MPIPNSNYLDVPGFYQPPVGGVAGMIAKHSFPVPYASPTVDMFGNIKGVSDVTQGIQEGWAGLYDKRANEGSRFYRSKDGSQYLLVAPTARNVNMEGYDEMPYNEFRRLLPKRDYIGGNNYRLRAAQRIPGLTELVYNRAKAYGIDQNLLLHRILKEGFIDKAVKNYNASDAAKQKSYWQGLWDREYSGFFDFGLDDAGSNLMDGKYELLDENAKWTDDYHVNEKGRDVVSVHTNDLKSMLEILAAEMAYRQAEVKKKYNPSDSELGRYTSASFNMGLNNSRLNEPDYVRKNYSYPDYYGQYGLKYSEGGKVYVGKERITHLAQRIREGGYEYVSGGKIRIKPENIGKFTDPKELTGHSAMVQKYGADAIRQALQKMRETHKYDGESEPTGYLMRSDAEGNLYDSIAPAVVTAKLPSKFHGSQAAARRYAEGYQFGKQIAEQRDTFASKHLMPVVLGLSAGPAGAISALAGQAVDMGVNVATGAEKDSWGDLLVDPVSHPIGNALAEMTNPAYLSAGSIKGMSALRKMLQGSRKGQRILQLYNYGKNPYNLNVLRNVDAEFRDAAGRIAQKQKPFTKTQKQEIAQRVLSSEAERVTDRLFGIKESYEEAFNKHATTPELKKLFRENPEYLYYVDKTGKAPLEQQTLDAFAAQQMRSVRGVHLDKATESSIKQSMTEFGRNIGGDRLQTHGGVYSSNSYAMADHYSRPVGEGIILDNVISELQYPTQRVGGDARKQLSLLRDNVLARDDWYESTNVLLHERPPMHDYMFVESPYATRRGSVLNVFERATTKPQSVSSIQSSVQHGLPDMHGRWGILGVPVMPEDTRLFIPKVTTRADLNKILSGGRSIYDTEVANDFLSTVANQNKHRIQLIQNSLPYKAGNHVYKSTGIVGGHEVYEPLLGVGAAAGVAGAAGSLIWAFNDVKERANEKAEREYEGFRNSPYYEEFISAGGGPKLYDEYFSRFKESQKSDSKKSHARQK